MTPIKIRFSNTAYFLILIILCSCNHSTKKEKEKDYSQDLNKKIKRIESNLTPVHYLISEVQLRSIAQEMQEQQIPGIGMAFINNGEVEWVKSYGYANVSDGTLINSETLFNGGSLSKPIAAVAALKLVHEKQLNLDSDVNDFLKGWKVPESSFTHNEKVTLRRLINHTSGIGNHLWSSYPLNGQVPTLEQMLAGEAPSVDPPVSFVYVPGTKEKYSNPAYSVIEKLIEDLSGQPFENAIDSLIFAQANMFNSTFQQPVPASLRDYLATGYEENGAPYPYKIFPFKAAGGIWTTPSDLAKFMAAVMNDYHEHAGVFFSKEMAEEVFSKANKRFVFSKKFKGDTVLFDHWGSNSGFSCYMAGNLDKKQGLVIMVNKDSGFDLIQSIARSVAVAYEWEFLQPEIYEKKSLDTEILKSYAYSFSDGKMNGETIIFKVEDNNLRLEDEGPGTLLIPVGTTKFIAPETNTTYEFLKNKEQRVQWVRITKDTGFNYDLGIDLQGFENLEGL